MANGRLDPRTLTKVEGWAFLTAPAAASWNAGCDEMVRRGYERPAITAPDGAYRTYAQQVYWKKYWTDRGQPENAATPGRSIHGWGDGVDIFKVWRFPRAALVEVFGKYGFTFTVASEPWHLHHDGTTPAGSGSTPIDLRKKDITMHMARHPVGAIALVGETTFQNLTGHQYANNILAYGDFIQYTAEGYQQQLIDCEARRQYAAAAVKGQSAQTVDLAAIAAKVKANLAADFARLSDEIEDINITIGAPTPQEIATAVRAAIIKD